MRGGLVAVCALVLGALAAPSGAEEAPFQDLLVDATAQVGVDFRHWNGMTGERYIHEILGGGGVLFDFDGDGDLDLYAVQGQFLSAPEPVKAAGGEEPKKAEPLFPPPSKSPRDRLFRNDLGPEGPRFKDVTEASGVEARGYGMGAVSADVDGDGWPDLYVLNWGANQLWRNRGDGTFEDITQKAGVGDGRWSTTATFWDYDRDGALDLFVGNYLDFELADHKACFAISGLADYCGPASYKAAADRLYRNRGNGTFEDVSARVGLGGVRAAALGSVSLDVDGDGGLELFVANDGMANHLWSFGGGLFREEALLAGCAVNVDGVAEASMGVDIGDVDGDGDEDLFMTHLDQETNTLYLNEGGFFEDVSDSAGAGVESFARTGFGTRLVDLDLDGWLDMVVVNGAIKSLEDLRRAGDPLPLRQKNQVYRNLGGRFRDATASVGAAFEPSHISRGLAAGDLDNDGDIDLIFFNNNGPLRVLLNQAQSPTRGKSNHWLGVDLREAKSGGPAIGSRVGVVVDGRTLWRRVQSGGSYASGQDPRVVFGLGGAREIEKVRVEWLGGGRVEEWGPLGVDRYHRLEQGGGRSPVPPSPSTKGADPGVGPSRPAASGG